MVNGDLDGSKDSRKFSSYKAQPVTVRHSDLADMRGFVPLITQEDLEKEGYGGAGNTTLDDVEVNNFVSPNISGINSNASGASPGRPRVNRSRKHNLSVDMNDLSAI